MKHTFFAGVFAVAFAIPSAQAQSSVQIYGILDAGVTMLSNVAGAKAWVSDSGVQQANRLGFIGSEDLGGGNKAVFRLENGFSLNNGTLGQGGLLFGRQAYVGLSNPFGTVTLGRQYDFMTQKLALDATAAFIGGLYDWHLGDQDRIAGEDGFVRIGMSSHAADATIDF
jgi:outer membrane protein OmpU